MQIVPVSYKASIADFNGYKQILWPVIINLNEKIKPFSERCAETEILYSILQMSQLIQYLVFLQISKQVIG